MRRQRLHPVPACLRRGANGGNVCARSRASDTCIPSIYLFHVHYPRGYHGNACDGLITNDLGLLYVDFVARTTQSGSM
jgi:hypothetical protein